MATISHEIKRVLAARDTARLDIFDKATQLEGRRETIKDNAYGRLLTSAELAELTDINSALGSLASAHSDLMLMTVQALNRTDEVTRFANILDAVNSELTAKLKNVQKIAANIKKLNEIFQKITAVINALSKLAPLLP